MKKGWVRLHRDIEDNFLYFLEPFTKAQAWIDMFLNANHKATTLSIKGNIVEVGRGQLAWSEVTMAKRWRWSRNKVRRFLKLLKTKQQIEQVATPITSLITINNYDEYQETEQQTIQQTIQQKDIRRNTNNNDNNEKNVKKETISKDIVEATPQPTYGNEDINNILTALKGKIGIESFVESSKWTRIYAKHCLALIKKISAAEFARRLDLLLDDPFTAKNCNKIKFVYNNIKGFIEPKIQSNSIKL